jgi:serine/tyrosine/threonine adenylyltransferase
MRRAAIRTLKASSVCSDSTRRSRFSSASMANKKSSPFNGVTLAELPKSHIFTTYLPPDSAIPSPQSSNEAPSGKLRISRSVQGALFTWVAPQPSDNPQLLATSKTALRDLGLKESELESDEFRKLMSGNMIYEEHYPWGIALYIFLY